VVFGNLIAWNYAFSAELQFDKRVLVTQISMACSSIVDNYQVFHFPSMF